MRESDFDESAPGQLVALEADVFAFVPAPLAPPLTISAELLRAAESARAAVGELRGEARLITNVDLVMGPLARREAVLSSRMEGTHTEVRELLLEEARNELANEDTDVFEVLNYLETISLAERWMGEGRRLGLPLVMDLHARLLNGVRGADKNPGALRRRNVFIGDRARGIQDARFVPPPVEHVRPLMEDLVAFMTEGAVTPLVDVAIAHYQFEAIHPFEDGNGRLGRLLIPLQMIVNGVLDRPLLYLSAALEARDEEYRDRLLAVSMRGEWSGWIMFFLRMVEVAAHDSSRRVRKLLELQETYRAAIAASRSAFVSQALDLALKRVYLSVADVERATGASYPGAKTAVEALVGAGVLVPHGRIRGRQVWRADELLREVYDA